MNEVSRRGELRTGLQEGALQKSVAAEDVAATNDLTSHSLELACMAICCAMTGAKSNASLAAAAGFLRLMACSTRPQDRIRVFKRILCVSRVPDFQ
jgi:hypothetical protein